jgi:hypothetical protein
MAGCDVDERVGRISLAEGAIRRCIVNKMADYAALIVLSQKVARFEFANQLFEKIQDWRARC